jgi:hypothetical protein
MNQIARFLYLVLLLTSVSIVFRLYTWFFKRIWDSDWALQYPQLLFPVGTLLVLCGVAVFINFVRSDAWKKLTPQNAIPAIIQNLVFQVTFWFGLGICLRTALPFWR